MVHEDRDHHDGVLRSLSLVYGGGVSQDQFVKLRHIIGHEPVVEVHGQLPFFQVHGFHDADVPIEDFFVVIVPDLHDLVTDAEDVSAALQSRFPGIQCLLQDLVQVRRPGHAPLHGRQHLDLRRRRPVITGELGGHELRDGPGRFLRENAAVLRVQALLPGLGLHIHEKEIACCAVADIRQFPLVDPVGIHDDPAGLGLPEDPCEPHHRKALRVDDVPQHVSCPDAGKLVDVTDQDQGHGVRDRL